mmetsp:Transcript_7445/g.6676  ORF Transcript_7445/g.6676 Transcript_7445/m.6676 type:complete len:145 (+) Transcript_7445:30-464(+)
MISLVIVVILCILTNTFGFKSYLHSNIRVNRWSSLSMKSYSVKVVNKKKNTTTTVSVPTNKFILDSCEEQLVQIPYSCRAGSCSSCLGLLKSGSVDQSGNIFLSDKHIDQGYVLTCVAYPQSDIEIDVDIEDEFYNLNPDLKVE